MEETVRAYLPYGLLMKASPLTTPSIAFIENSSRSITTAVALGMLHRVLVYYFPQQQAALDATYNASLAKLTATSRAKREGVRVGEASAQALISARTGDGLLVDVPYQPGSGPGVWQPTPPGFLPTATPWLGQMRPFILRSASQFLPSGPTKLSGEEWAANYNVTRLLGDKTSSVRTAGQTEIGLFWTENTSQQYARVFNYLVQNYRLDLMDSARMMAMLWTGAADSIYRLLQREVHLQLLAAGDGDTSGGRR